jgi:hypothetical protein
MQNAKRSRRERGPNGPRRSIVDETLIWTADGYAIFEVLSCGHIRPLEHDENGQPTAWKRCCRQCIGHPLRPSWTTPSAEVSERRSMNWYEELIAWNRAPTMCPFVGYKFGEGPKGRLLAQMRELHELMCL